MSASQTRHPHRPPAFNVQAFASSPPPPLSDPHTSTSSPPPQPTAPPLQPTPDDTMLNMSAVLNETIEVGEIIDEERMEGSASGEKEGHEGSIHFTENDSVDFSHHLLPLVPPTPTTKLSFQQQSAISSSLPHKISTFRPSGHPSSKIDCDKVVDSRLKDLLLQHHNSPPVDTEEVSDNCDNFDLQAPRINSSQWILSAMDRIKHESFPASSTLHQRVRRQIIEV